MGRKVGGGPGPGASDLRETRVKRALANPIYFGQAYFAPYDPKWQDNLLPTFAVDMLKFCAGIGQHGWPHAAGVIMLPPEFLKTTLISQVLPLWATVRARVRNELLRGMLFSEQEQMATGNLAVLSWHLLQNERLRADFKDSRGVPLLRPDPEMDTWREDSIVVHRPGIVSRDPTWQAKGLDSSGIQGRRIDYFIGDDVVTPRNASSPALRQRALETFELTIQTRLVQGATVLMAGNFNDAKDLLSQLAERSRWRSFRRPSLHKPGRPSEAPKEQHLFDPEQSVATWPENWNHARLRIEWQERPGRFRRIHLLDPRAEQGSRLQTGWVTVMPEAEAAPLLKYARIFIGCDPAPGGDSEDVDFCNISVVALTQQHADLVQSFSVRGPMPRQVSLLGRIHDAYVGVGHGVVAIGVSKTTADRYFAGAFEISRPDLKHKLVPISIPSTEAAKEIRLEGLGPKAHSGWVRVWDSAWRKLTSDEIDRPQELTLEEEWREFPYGNHDDRLDGLDLALRTAEEFALVGDTTVELTLAEL